MAPLIGNGDGPRDEYCWQRGWTKGWILLNGMDCDGSAGRGNGSAWQIHSWVGILFMAWDGSTRWELDLLLDGMREWFLGIMALQQSLNRMRG